MSTEELINIYDKHKSLLNGMKYKVSVDMSHI